MELVLVVDSRIFARLGRSEARVHGASQQLVARMSDIYRPLNIYLALAAVVIWRNHDQEHNYTSDGLYHMDTKDKSGRISLPNNNIVHLYCFEKVLCLQSLLLLSLYTQSRRMNDEYWTYWTILYWSGAELI